MSEWLKEAYHVIKEAFDKGKVVRIKDKIIDYEWEFCGNAYDVFLTDDGLEFVYECSHIKSYRYTFQENIISKISVYDETGEVCRILPVRKYDGSIMFVDTRKNTSEYRNIHREIIKLKKQIKEANYDLNTDDGWFEWCFDLNQLKELIDERNELEKEMG